MLKIQRFISFFITLKPILLVKRAFFLLNATGAMEILALISCVHLASFVIILFK